MMKPLIGAAALAALSGAAQAQSSVTIYGLVDQGVVKMNNSTSIGANPGAGINGTVSMKGANQSRLGFRGVEDLGGGLSAFFHLEHRFSVDDGAAATPFWTGRSVVGFTSKSWGDLWMGRDYTAAFYPTVAVDPFNWNYTGQMGIRYTQAAYSGTDGGPRDNNMVLYKTPNLNGLTAMLTYALGENSTVRGRALGGNLVYAKGPIYAGLAFDRSKAPTPAGSEAKLDVIVGAYDFGVVRPRFSVARSTSFAGVESKSYMLGVSVPAGPGRILAAYGRLNPDGANNDSSKFGLGYQYDLSKRTTLYVDVGSARLDGGNRSTGYDLGIKHTF